MLKQIYFLFNLSPFKKIKKIQNIYNKNSELGNDNTNSYYSKQNDKIDLPTASKIKRSEMASFFSTHPGLKLTYISPNSDKKITLFVHNSQMITIEKGSNIWGIDSLSDEQKEELKSVINFRKANNISEKESVLSNDIVVYKTSFESLLFYLNCYDVWRNGIYKFTEDEEGTSLYKLYIDYLKVISKIKINQPKNKISKFNNSNEWTESFLKVNNKITLLYQENGKFVEVFVDYFENNENNIFIVKKGTSIFPRHKDSNGTSIELRKSLLPNKEGFLEQDLIIKNEKATDIFKAFTLHNPGTSWIRIKETNRYLMEYFKEFKKKE